MTTYDSAGTKLEDKAGRAIEDARGEVALSPDDLWDALPEMTKRKLKSLTSKQRDFALLVTHGVHKDDAYRYAYDVSPETKDTSVAACASKILNTDSMKKARAAIENGAMSAMVLQSDAPPMTKQWVLERLGQEAGLRKNTGNVRVRALELIGRAQGMFQDAQPIGDDDAPESADEAKARLEKLLARASAASDDGKEIVVPEPTPTRPQLQAPHNTSEEE